MRVIKFRAWLPSIKKMEIGLFGLRSDGVPNFNCEAILMQFTGIKDKNDKEIYEGDILSDSHRVIGFREGSFIALDYSEEIKMDLILGSNWEGKELIHYYKDELEVIGNIYENQELVRA